MAPRLVSGASPVEPLFSVSNPAVVVEAVKLAEDGSGDVIARLYESLGQRSAGRLTANFPVQRVTAVDLLERAAVAPGVESGTDGAELLLRPFQLVTLRFARADG
jgi:alpha-mannosidase